MAPTITVTLSAPNAYSSSGVSVHANSFGVPIALGRPHATVTIIHAA